jgi:hypothetical protein
MLVANTPEQVSYVQLASLKQAVKLESKGLKLSRGASAKSNACRMLGLSTRTKHDVVINTIQDKMKEILDNMQK